METTIDQTDMESGKRRESWDVGMAKKWFFAVTEMCVLEAKDKPVQATVSLAIYSVNEAISDKGVIAGCMQKATMRAHVHPSKIKADSDVLLENDSTTAAIAAFV